MRASVERFAVVVAAVAVASAACRGEKKKEPTTFARAGAGDSAVLPRVVRTDATASTRATSLTVDGRKVVLIEPARGAPPGERTATMRPRPLVIVFHGDGGDADELHRDWPFEQASGDEAFVAYADARHPQSWDLETTHGNKDVAHVVLLIDTLASRLPIDRARVFLTGYSSGGFFANTFACQRSDLVRAIASNAGGAPYNQAERWPNGFPKCPGQRPVAAMALHGRRDYGVTLDSGRFTAEYWANVDGCNAAEMETTGYDLCRAYRGCPRGNPVVWCEIPDLGHWVWDHAAEASWTFFERLPPRDQPER